MCGGRGGTHTQKTSNCQKCHTLVVGLRTIRYLEGGYSFCWLKTFFSPPQEAIFFLAICLDTSIFFIIFFEELNFFYRRPTPSLLCTLPFGGFSGQHIFHQFRQQTFFFCPHFQQTFFFNFFRSPPPQISNGYSLIRDRPIMIP